ncbi:protein of unknown function [Cardinium endosymbiont cEper1 of Encarsia pergandiella]|nr:protein of unknown function [Cardinium endosymbiont cEper1 of Encarsia pergandiella]
MVATSHMLHSRYTPIRKILLSDFGKKTPNLQCVVSTYRM